MKNDDCKYQIGVDIGASKVNIGIVDSRGFVQEKERFMINREMPSDAILNHIVKGIFSCIQRKGMSIDDIGYMGIGIPGTVDNQGKCVIYAPNLNWRNVNIGSVFKKHFPFELDLEQDAKAAAVGEFLVGAGRGMDEIVCLTLGTGIGCGLIINKKIFRGSLNTAGEIGHIIVDPEGPRCNCGKTGCLEIYSSGTGLSQQATQALGRFVSSEKVFELSKSNQIASQVIDKGAQVLGTGIVNIINLLSPQAVILSGGLADQDYYIDKIKQFVYKYAYELALDPNAFTFCKAELGVDAPMIGASMLRFIE